MEMSFDTQKFEEAINKILPGLTMLVRDVNLDPAIAEKYTDGLIIREKGFADASSRVMGMVTTHRYAILSNHMTDLSQLGEGPNWGLCVAQRDSHFKVLGQAHHNGKTAIFLLHLPDDESWKLFQDVHINIEDDILNMCIERFKAKCDAPPVPELATEEWLQRCAFPIGFDDQGNQFDLE